MFKCCGVKINALVFVLHRIKSLDISSYYGLEPWDQNSAQLVSIMCDSAPLWVFFREESCGLRFI